MGKVITVWGSPGSGKSMFCCILAKALTRDKRKAIIINADMNVPMLPVWLPEQIIQTNTSIGQVLSSVEIDTSLVASHVTVLKNYPFIGMMGYAAGENPLSYPEVKYAMVLQLIHAAAKLVDFVILDCSTSMTNVFTPAAIEAGDVVIRILTPDLKGINYLKAHQPLLVDERAEKLSLHRDDGICGRRKPAELPRGQICHGTAAHSCCRQAGRFRHSGLQHQHDQCVHSRRH